MKIQKQPLFIIGNGRSGTTMLGMILTQSGIGVSFEGHFVVKALKKFGLQINTKAELKALINTIQSFESSKRFNFVLDDKDYNLTHPIPTRRVITDALEKIANKHPNHVWIEKTPHYINDLALILDVFPDAKIIWMLRDGRDVANSVIKKSWGANNFYYAAKDWVKSNYENSSLRDRRVLMVKYEDLLAEPTAGLRDIFKFLDFSGVNYANLASPINPSKMYQWKNLMSEEQINAFESIAFDCLKQHGYETINRVAPELSSTKIIIYKLHHNTLLLIHLFKVNITTPLLIKLGFIKAFNEKD